MGKAFTNHQISNYYNGFRTEEKDLKLNVRHYTVFKQLVKSGLRKNHDVLEIGCGFGTVTYLMSKYIDSGTIVATDISEERIKSCIENFSHRTNVSFVLTDMREFKTTKRFDFIVLPDVLEHIPLELHSELFVLLADLLKEDGTIFIHIPHPLTIEYLRKFNPSALQIIDQAVYSEQLLLVANCAGLIVRNITAYSLASNVEDYQIIILKKAIFYNKMLPISKTKTRWKKAMAICFFRLRTIF